jgi:hypothetical protein
MPADTHQQDPMRLWQDQEPETDPVTLEQIHDLTRKFDRKTRFVPAIMAFGLVAAGFLTAQLWLAAHDGLRRLSAILFIAGQLGCYFLIYRVVFPPRDPAAPASDHLRHRLQLRLSYRQGGVVVVLLPLLPFLLVAGYEAISRNRHGPLWATLAPFVLCAAALAFLLVRARIGARQTRAQLEDLEALLKR